MSTGLKSVVRRLKHIATRARTADQTDRQLLQRFARTGEEAAFAALVDRYGALVLGVCRRVLHHAADAEDAFQATFLVLAKKAGSQSWQDSISNWLHGVAYRISMKARTEKARRRRREQKAGEQTSTEPQADVTWRELRGVLDEELAKLPARYRAPLILCYLEGKTRDEAAGQLGWTPGSVKGRLERGRELLRGRLARRGLALSAVLCATLLPETAGAAVPASLCAATIQAGLHFAAGHLTVVSSGVLSLAQGVLYTMLLTKLKIATAVVLMAGFLGIGGGLVTRDALAASDDLPAATAQAVVSGQDKGERQAEREQKRDRPKEGDRPKDGDRRKDAERKEGDRPKEGDRRRDGDRELGKGEVRGIVQAVDVAKGTLTLTLGGERRNPSAHTYSLAGKDVPVATGTGQKLKLTDLTEGLRVVIRLSSEEDVTRIEVEAPRIGGVLAAVDPAKSTIELRGGEESPNRTLKVAADARFLIEGREAKLASFKPGMRVFVTLALDKSAVVELQSGFVERERGVGGERGEGRNQPHLRGILIGKDAAKNTIELLVGGDAPEVRTLELGKDAKIGVRYGDAPTPIAFADLAKAVHVGLWLTDDRKVSVIEVTPPRLAAAPVKAVDSAKRTITLQAVRERPEQTLAVAADARISIVGGGEGTTLADVTPGMRVHLTLSPDRSRVVMLRAIREEK
jgi:RNA polymerase sigma factor (sigma-70 family)